MKLTIRQMSNIRHFIYYLVNGTLDFELLNSRLSVNYYDYLKTHPELFYKTCCVFINQEVKDSPSWPHVKRLAQFICKEIDPQNNQDLAKLEDWEFDFQIYTTDLAGSFKSLSKWFIQSSIVDGVEYSNYIEAGASFVEQCFAIWANVIVFEEQNAVNYDHAINRVTEYIKSYFDPNYEDNLEEWEIELHME